MNHKLTLVLGVILLSVCGVLLVAAQQKNINSQRGGGKADANNYRLTGPYTHKNLSIFLIHSKTTTTTKTFLTLQEALEQKKVVVYETKDVNELARRCLGKCSTRTGQTQPEGRRQGQFDRLRIESAIGGGKSSRAGKR